MTGPTVDVHWADPATVHHGLLELLDDHETDRHGRFVRRQDRDRYLAAHSLARILLGARTGIAPQSLTFDRTCVKCGAPHGKPELIAAGGLRFSLSHSGSRVVVAISEGSPVGVDVEAIGSANGLATELLDGWELDRLPDGADRDRALTVWWARKEALLKATGDGLSVEPTTLRVSPPDAEPELLSWTDGPKSTLFLRDLHPGPGYCAAVAVMVDSPMSVFEHPADALLAGHPRH